MVNQNYELKSPLLLITFNRLNTTKEVLKMVKKVKPKKLYISSDGPRKDKLGENELVHEVRDFILNNINWDCEVKTLFRDENMSCGPSVKNAIDWFFENEDAGIILEDDVKPNQSFFKFCDELLLKYKDDDRIGMISGNNHINYAHKKDSYMFSRFFYTWGWATWKRSWKNMDLDMNWAQTSYRDSIVSNMGYTKKSILHWENNIDAINTNRVNAWDYQWFLSLSSQNQLSVVPTYNLVSNIGFGDNATHTFGVAKDEYINTKELTFPLIHPSQVVPFLEFEKKYEDIRVMVSPLWKRVIPYKVKNILKKFL